MECLSHPNRLLLDHLESVEHIGISTYETKDNLNLHFAAGNIRIALSNMLFYHDIGKSTKFFQEYIRASAKNVVYKGKSELKNHSLISAVYAAYKTYIDLKDISAKSFLPILVFLAVRKHHGNFENIKDMLSVGKSDWHNLQIQWHNLNFGCLNKSNNLNFKDAKNYVNDLPFALQDIDTNSDNYFLLNFFFSILTYSDKNDAKFHHQIVSAVLPKAVSHWTDKYKISKFGSSKPVSKLNIARNEIYDSSAEAVCQKVGHNIYSINVPTGSGKTLAGINAALRIIDKDKHMKKIIYALPFTSIVEQTYNEFFDILKCNVAYPENYLVKHHHLAEAKIKNDENDYSGNDAQFLIENWDKSIILTTFWQFFNAVISNQNKIIRKFHNIANSVIILDEIQTMPIEYWKLIRDILIKLTDTFNCRIIFMTATLPSIFSEEKNEIFPLINKGKTLSYFRMFSRYKLETVNGLNPISIDNLFDIAVKKISSKPQNSFMFVFNTIQSSLDFYKKLSKSIDEHIIYLSGNIIPKDRLKRIDQIKNQCGKKIVVSTQLIEAGVDIDIDIIYRDFAPFDSIVQTAGRCNRNGKLGKLGRVYITKLIDAKNNKKYCNYIYKPAAIGLTDNLLKEYAEIKEGDLLKIIKSYYDKINDISSSDESESIISGIRDLNYADISDKFNLIKNIPDVLVFVEKDETASCILEQLKNILKLDDKWERKDKFLGIKKDFYSYILSVKIGKKSIESINNFKDVSGIKVITREMIKTFYDNDIGFTYEFDNFI